MVVGWWVASSSDGDYQLKYAQAIVNHNYGGARFRLKYQDHRQFGTSPKKFPPFFPAPCCSLSKW